MRPSPTTPLTAHEYYILELVSQGLSNRQIGAKLYLSEYTIKTHMWRISKKLGVSGREAQVMFVMNWLLAEARWHAEDQRDAQWGAGMIFDCVYPWEEHHG